MTKKMNTFSTIAESINDLTLHRINKNELYEILCNCVMESTLDDKEQIVKQREYGTSNDYLFGKNWLLKK